MASLPPALVVSADAAPTLPGRLELRSLVVEGGRLDDQIYARAAAGLEPGDALEPEAWAAALAAVRATDRFRGVEGSLEPLEGGLRARLRLEPWGPIQGLRWTGDALPRALRKAMAEGIHRGARPGEARLEAWRRQGEARLREAGYPEGELRLCRGPEERLVALVRAGPLARVTAVDLAGDLGPYTRERLLAMAGIKVGRTVWTARSRDGMLKRLQSRFRRARRWEWRGDVQWLGEGRLRLTVTPGPRVDLVREGKGLGRGGVKELAPLAQAPANGPQVLEEGDRRMVRRLREKGFLDARVDHRRDVVEGSAAQPRRVTVTYQLSPGELVRLDGVAFEGNRQVPARDLEKAAPLPSRVFSLGRSPKASPQLLDRLEQRVKDHYLERGFTEVRVVRRVERSSRGIFLVFQVKEGPRRFLEGLVLDLPLDLPGNPWPLGGELAQALPGPFRLERPSGELARVRAPGGGAPGSLERRVLAQEGIQRFRLTLDPPPPLVKARLAQVLLGLRRRLEGRGLSRPDLRLRLEAREKGTAVVLELGKGPVERIRRLVVEGADRSRAHRVLGAAALPPGALLDPAALALAQTRVGNLAAFSRVELGGLPGEERPWGPGDLRLHLQERYPWEVSSSFGYEALQGYRVGLGVKRLNLGGAGREMDLGIQAGDATLRNPTLHRLFPTGGYRRSLDAYTLGYSDPAVPTPLPWVPPQARLRVVAAHILESRSVYRVRRRRLAASLQWDPGRNLQLEAGYRQEWVSIASSLEGLQDQDLEKEVRSPLRSQVGAPYLRLSRDLRDSPLSPTRGTFWEARAEWGLPFWGTARANAFLRVEGRHQWNWPLGSEGGRGVVSLGLRAGLARPTGGGQGELPLSELYLAGGPLSHRGVEPEGLGPLVRIPLREKDPPFPVQLDGKGEPRTRLVAAGGQALALANLDYRFPLGGPTLWGEVFLDAGQVYRRWTPRPAAASPGGPAQASLDPASRPPLRCSLGVGLVIRTVVPIKVEYAQDLKRLLGRPRTPEEEATQVKNVFFSVGFQF